MKRLANEVVGAPAAASQLYSERADAYLRFIRAVGYPRGLRAAFMKSPELGSGMRLLDAGCGTGVTTLALRSALEARGMSARALRGRLHARGKLLLFITRNNALMRPLIEHGWAANLYTQAELRSALEDAGFTEPSVRRFPFPYRYLDVWGHVVSARA